MQVIPLSRRSHRTYRPRQYRRFQHNATAPRMVTPMHLSQQPTIPTTSDIQLQIQPITETQWRLQLHTSQGDHTTLDIPAILNQDLQQLSELPSHITTWKQLLRQLQPQGILHQATTLRSIGQLIYQKIFHHPDIIERFERSCFFQPPPHSLIRLTITLPPSPIKTPLPYIPFELTSRGIGAAHEFLFKHPQRCLLFAPLSSSLLEPPRLPSTPQILVATAHIDQQKPSREDLHTYVDALIQVLPPHWKLTHLPDATNQTLRHTLQNPYQRFDLLYLIGHGQQELQDGGEILLRDQPIKATELSDLLRQSTIPSVVLCTCSSQAPTSHPLTASLTEWLVERGGVHNCLGFRGDIGVKWAMNFGLRWFQNLGETYDFAQATAQTRSQEKEYEAQWALPRLITRRPLLVSHPPTLETNQATPSDRTIPCVDRVSHPPTHETNKATPPSRNKHPLLQTPNALGALITTPPIEPLFEKIETHLAHGEIEESIEQFRDVFLHYNAPRQTKRVLLGLSGSYHRLHKDIQAGILSLEDTQLEQNRIQQRLLHVLDTLRKRIADNNPLPR